MKSKLIVLLSVFTLVIAGNNNAQQVKSSSLFDKQDENWVCIINNKQIAPKEVFKFADGVMKISGVSNGYIRTKRKYSNYVLSLEWRWTKKLGNSGVLVHIQPKDTIWPICYQVQQKAEAAGDIICMNGLKAKECSDTVKFTVKKMLTSNEKLLGDWNSMKVVCRKNTMKVFINGVLQNSISEMNVKKGYIGFQNEGTEMEFRELKIK